jgi:hypothetical protein
MPSTYSNLKIELMATGENNTTWGQITNTNLNAIEEAIAGSVDVTFAGANVTLTLTNTNASQTARNLRLRCVGSTGGASRNLVVPDIEKPYIVQNNCADNIVVKTSAGSGVTVPPGKTMWVYSDGTNVVDVITHLPSLTLGTALSVANGGTGATSFTANRLLRGNGTGALQPSGVFDQSTTEAIHIDASNNVGIGGVSPGERLSVQASNTVQIGATDGVVAQRVGLCASGVAASGTGTDHPFILLTNDIERMRITTAGNVGIGTTNPSERLTVSGNANISGSLTLGTALSVANGGTGATTASAARTNLGATTVGANIFTLANPSAVSFLRVNADNTVTARSAADFRSDIGAGTGNGTVTSVSGTGSANGLSLSGTVTGSGNITLSGSVTSVASNATIDGVTIGFRNIPRSTTSGTATTGDVGKYIAATAGITIPSGTFAAGDAVSIYNDSASSITITQGSGLTLRLAGTANTGNRTLAQRGMATIWFNSANEAIISGSGLS